MHTIILEKMRHGCERGLTTMSSSNKTTLGFPKVQLQWSLLAYGYLSPWVKFWHLVLSYRWCQNKGGGTRRGGEGAPLSFVGEKMEKLRCAIKITSIPLPHPPVSLLAASTIRQPVSASSCSNIPIHRPNHRSKLHRNHRDWTYMVTTLWCCMVSVVCD
jgi:hypothetical protein